MKRKQFKIDLFNNSTEEKEVVLFGMNFTRPLPGSTPGQELQVNGNFQSSSGGWYNSGGILIPNLTRVVSGSGYAFHLYYVTSPQIFTGHILTIGMKYVLSAFLPSVAGSVSVFEGASNTALATTSTPGFKSFEFIASATSIRIVGGYDSLITNVSIKALDSEMKIVSDPSIETINGAINAGAFRVERLVLTSDQLSQLTLPITLCQSSLSGQTTIEPVFPIDRFGGFQVNNIVSLSSEQLNGFTAGSDSFMKFRIQGKTFLSLFFDGAYSSFGDALNNNKQIEYYD
ncbi:MAG TPA: hypothetical protein VF691_04205 [Cytophagaceae bacterium]|jgi:hypothetical protein